jgi:hypothetical protein
MRYANRTDRSLGNNSAKAESAGFLFFSANIVKYGVFFYGPGLVPLV